MPGLENLSNSSTAMSTMAGKSSNFTLPPFLPCTAFQQETTTTRDIKAIALCFIMATSFVGNIFIIVVVSKTKALHRTVNLFILNMSVSDLMMMVVIMPQELITVITGSSAWRVSGLAGVIFCKMYVILLDSSAAVSILSMVCIAIDRFCAVVLPMKRNLITGKLRSAAIALTWALAIVYTAPGFYTARVQNFQGLDYCIMQWEPLDHLTSMNTNIIMMAVLFLVTPWLLVVIMYTVMVFEIRRSRREVDTRSRHRRRDLRVLKLALTIITAFALCNFPMCIMLLMLAFKYNWIVCYQPHFWSPLFTAAKYLVLANTSINPCICFAFSENFRKGLRDVTRAQRSFIFSLVSSKRGNSTRISQVDTGDIREGFMELKDNGSSSFHSRA